MKKHHPLRMETRSQPLISRAAFAKRLGTTFAAASVLIGVSLFGGMLGYHYLEGMDWLDSFSNASMILSGMGPLAPLQTREGKFFAGCYALYSGLALVLASGLILAPLIHRLLHRFHLEDEKQD